MLCNLKHVDGQTLIYIGIGINAVYLVCNRLIKHKPNWLSFLMGAAAALAIVSLVLGLIRLNK